MKKIYTILTTLLILLGALVSCQQQTGESERQTDPETLETDLKETIEPTKTKDSTDAMGGTSGMCSVHYGDYHAFSNELISYVGEQNFYAWVEEAEKGSEKNGCLYPESTIYDFIHYFNIPRSLMEELYLNDPGMYYFHVWNMDLLYSDDKDAVDAYYRDVDALQNLFDKRKSFRNMKFNINTDYESEWSQKFEDRQWIQISMTEIVSALNITRSELENYAEESIDPGCESYDYNYDAIYNADGSIRGTGVTLFSTDPEPALAADAAFCGIDDYYLE